MPDPRNSPPAERLRRDPTPVAAPARTAAPLRAAPSTAGIRVLQNRRAPAQLSLFQRTLPGR